MRKAYRTLSSLASWTSVIASERAFVASILISEHGEPSARGRVLGSKDRGKLGTDALHHVLTLLNVVGQALRRQEAAGAKQAEPTDDDRTGCLPTTLMRDNKLINFVSGGCTPTAGDGEKRRADFTDQSPK
jgi:hypothetical protein